MSTPNGPFGFGSPASPEQIAGWDIDIEPDGTGLPPGSGTVQQGQEIFARLGAKCHGTKGEGTDKAPPLVGGIGSLTTDAPLKTVGSYWPYATTLYDYIHRAMPADKPQSLQPEEVYALCAYLLYLNGIVPEDAVMDATTLPQVVMPNHAGFTSPDPRPDVFNTDITTTTITTPAPGQSAASQICLAAGDQCGTLAGQQGRCRGPAAADNQAGFLCTSNQAGNPCTASTQCGAGTRCVVTLGDDPDTAGSTCRVVIP